LSKIKTYFRRSVETSALKQRDLRSPGSNSRLTPFERSSSDERFFKSEISDFEISDLKPEITDPGGGEGTRTPDPRVANAVLCQLSYTPESEFEISNFKFAISWRLVAGAGFEPATFGL
jgi:hypothetical protein